MHSVWHWLVLVILGVIAFAIIRGIRSGRAERALPSTADQDVTRPSGDQLTSPAVRAYMTSARAESQRTVDILSRCQTGSEIVRGFAQLADVIRAGTGNEKLLQVATMIGSGESGLSDDQLLDLRDECVAVARAFLSTTEGSV